ncbi:MAG: hypothetical protein ABIS50_01345 [Luteolibacter sp.]|uniref:hypothetical protein n=1 Tax=Luteolibacter sp. TaxID=1962973 RepID=UPI0032637845
MNPLRRPCGAHVKIPRPRAAGFAGWMVPSVLLVLIPKCPACFAAYVALASGIGLSIPVADGLRTALILLCAASLGFLAIRKLRRVIQNHSNRQSSVLNKR